jgi:hypothetical protein
MKPLTAWQLKEVLDSELRRPQWHILLDMKGREILADVALLILDQTIKDLEAQPSREKAKP